MKNKMYKLIAKWVSNSEGTTALEYTFIGAGVGLVLVSGLMLFSDEFNTMMTLFSDSIQNSIINFGI